ncbi:MAG: FAD-binding oxidoreductase [Pseudomonadota bacterium]
MRTCDILVIGGGIAGMSAAAELADLGKVVLLEREAFPGSHSTGRSAATFLQIYGPPTVRRLVRAGRDFLENPPDGFCDHPILSPRGLLQVALPGHGAQLLSQLEADRAFAPELREISPEEALEIVPILRPERVEAAIYEPTCRDIDVDALLQGYQRRFKALGGSVETSAEVSALARQDGVWRVTMAAGAFEAPVVVNAAGAWADEIAGLAGLTPLGLVPKRRTAFTFDPPEGIATEAWPLTLESEETFYFKPDAGRLLGSPADATPVPPQDVQPEEWDIAVGVDRIVTATTLEIRRLAHTWAGLRTFAQDGVPVAGFDETCEGFFWLAGQGGYGIKTAPALSRLAAAAIGQGGFPEDLGTVGLTAADLAPGRLRSGATD